MPDAARGAGGVIQRSPGPGGAEGELAGLLVALELIGFLVDAVFEAGADGMRARRLGERGGHRVIVHRPVFIGVPVADVAGEVDAREAHLVLRHLVDELLREAQRSQVEADRFCGLIAAADEAVVAVPGVQHHGGRKRETRDRRPRSSSRSRTGRRRRRC